LGVRLAAKQDKAKARIAARMYPPCANLFCSELAGGRIMPTLRICPAPTFWAQQDRAGCGVSRSSCRGRVYLINDQPL
jgi:hypothetical protein